MRERRGPHPPPPFAHTHTLPPPPPRGVWRLQINGSLARAAIRELRDNGTIRVVVDTAKQKIYTRATAQ